MPSGFATSSTTSCRADFPYLTFFPAVIITTFLAGTAPGALVGILGGLAAWYFFIPPFDSFGLTGGSLLALAFYVFIVAVDIALIHWMHVALDRLTIEKEATARYANERDLLFRELQHRVSNNLAVVSALLTRRLASPPPRRRPQPCSRRPPGSASCPRYSASCTIPVARASTWRLICRNSARISWPPPG
ncbi:DUF4118 domain-containing protein [Aurantimonas sp. A2-1-M11]|uniref:DUF4118 domain-containing protein n=1 Tax=Aurantimonas sp. A2-1-M11 TaxID=3113712 RepID=UPI003FA55CCD